MSDLTLDRTRHWLAGASSVKESAKSWRSARVTACRDLLTNERKRDTSLPYARCVLGLRPCSHRFSNCSSLLACWLAGPVIPPSSTVLGEATAKSSQRDSRLPPGHSPQPVDPSG